MDTLTNGPHDLTATATDVASNVGSASGPLQVSIDTAAPGMISANVGTRAENASGGAMPVVVLTVASEDNLSGDSESYTLGGPDASSFAIQNGQLVYTRPALDYEDPDAQHQLSVTVTPTDAAGDAGTPQTIMVNLADVNDSPVYVISDASVVEGGTLQFTVTSGTAVATDTVVTTDHGSVTILAGATGSSHMMAQLPGLRRISQES